MEWGGGKGVYEEIPLKLGLFTFKFVIRKIEKTPHVIYLVRSVIRLPIDVKHELKYIYI